MKLSQSHSFSLASAFAGGLACLAISMLASSASAESDIGMHLANNAVPAVAGAAAASCPLSQPSIDGRNTYMATAENFSGITGNGLGANANGKKTTLPQETHLAWSEYLANVYLQCDDFSHARDIVTEMYNWMSEPARLSKHVRQSVEIIQRRIDERHECIMTQYGPGGACRRDRLSTASTTAAAASTNTPATDSPDPTMEKVMERVQKVSTEALTPVEQEQVDMIHKLLRGGYVNSAMQTFHQIAQASRTAVLKEPFGRLEFVLKMIRFDLENPNNCMPLWRTVCCLDWKMKHHILDAFDLLSGRAFHDQRNSEQPKLKQILSRLDDMPMANELKTRLLVADGRNLAWNHLDYLPKSDQYIAQACLILKGVKKPKELPDKPRMRFNSNAAADQLDARSQAKELYRQCIAEANGAPNRCVEGLAELEGLEKSCPYGGFLRLGVFSHIFENFLFIKCLSLPYTVPAGLPNLPSLEDAALEAKAEIKAQMTASASSVISDVVSRQTNAPDALAQHVASGAANNANPAGTAAAVKDNAGLMDRLYNLMSAFHNQLQKTPIISAAGDKSAAAMDVAHSNNNNNGGWKDHLLTGQNPAASTSPSSVAPKCSISSQKNNAGASSQPLAGDGLLQMTDALAELAKKLESHVQN